MFSGDSNDWKNWDQEVRLIWQSHGLQNIALNTKVRPLGINWATKGEFYA